MCYSLAGREDAAALLTPDGRTVFEYRTAAGACFHPVFTPSGERLTDVVAPGGQGGIFLGWHAMEFRRNADFSALGRTAPPRGWVINRADFWGWGQYAPTEGRLIRNREIAIRKADRHQAELEIVNDWTIDGRVFATEAAVVAVQERDQAFVISFFAKLTPALELVLDQTAFGGFCVRLRHDGDAYSATPRGTVLMPDPHYSSPELNWPAAPWYDTTLTLADGRRLGGAVIDHPSNPPSTWHNPRHLSILNPCIVANGPVRIDAGMPFRLRYRVVAHDGPTPSMLLDRFATEWRTSPSIVSGTKYYGVP